MTITAVLDRQGLMIPVGTQTFGPVSFANNVFTIMVTVGMWPKEALSLDAVFETFDNGVWTQKASISASGGGDPAAKMQCSFFIGSGTNRDVRVTTTVVGGSLRTSVLIETDDTPVVQRPSRAG